MDVKKVRWVAAGGLIVAAAAGLYVLTRPEKPAAPAPTSSEPPSKDPAPLEARAKQTTSPRAEAPQREVVPKAGLSPLRDVDKSILDYLENGPPEKGKGKDVFPGGQAKVTVLADEDLQGHLAIHHVEVDLDRDGKVDEVWRIQGKAITREANPPDDHSPRARDVFVMEDNQWKLVMGHGDTLKPPAVTSELRPMDLQILAVLRQGKAARDSALAGQPYHVTLFRAVSGVPNGVGIDLDNDGQLDEKWSIDDTLGITRQVSPQDDQQYSETYRLKGGKWSKL